MQKPIPTSARESKPLGSWWYWAYLGAAMVLAGAVAGAWWVEAHRPWKEEVRAIYARRGRMLYERLVSAGLNPARARARSRRIAEAPPRVVEIVPALTGKAERCLTCHEGIEDISPSHPPQAVGCVICHGGNPLGLTRRSAHQGLWGRNPSALAVAPRACSGGRAAPGRCHSATSRPFMDHVHRVQRTIMATMSGVIASLRAGWGAQDKLEALYGAVEITAVPGPPGTLAQLMQIPGPGKGSTLADDHWRKMCARCHLNAVRPSGPNVHGAGCAACHGTRVISGRYLGSDAAIARDEPGHAAFHRLLPTPPSSACLRCHNRSARIGLSYYGWAEDEASRGPWHQGRINAPLSGGRGKRAVVMDVHAEAGMECIDCHGPWDVMGDGRLYGFMREQVGIRCENCHGSGLQPPATAPAGEAAIYFASRGSLARAPKIGPTTLLALDAKARPMPRVRLVRGRLLLYPARTPMRPLAVPPARDPVHTIPGHKRLACQACHSRWSPNCMGCHEIRLPEARMWDYATGALSLGGWKETRDIYRLGPGVLGVDSRGKIRPFVPG